MSDKNCPFCNIAFSRTDTVLELETDDYVIFKDIRPAARHHYLIVPKQHFESLMDLDKSHSNLGLFTYLYIIIECLSISKYIILVCLMQAEVKHFMESKGICTRDALFGFHLPPFTSIKHLHMHAIAPRSEMGFLSRLIFRPYSFWFKTVSSP